MKDDFIKIFVTHTNNNTSVQSNISILANNSTTNNYTRQILFGNGTSVVADRGTSNAVAFETVPLRTQNYFGYIKLSENNVFNSFGNYDYNSGPLLVFNYITSSGATFANGITSITLQSGVTNGLGAGSRIQIYRLAAEKVADITVTSNTTQVDITGLDIQKGSEYLLVSDMVNGSTSSNLIQLFVNNNTTRTNYYTQIILGNGSSAVAGRSNYPEFAGYGSGERMLTYSHIKLSNIGAYTAQNYSIRNYGTNTLSLWNNFLSSTFENLTSINQINIVSLSSNMLGTGTRFQLYKLY
jgi:hypothetical protein